MRLRASPAFVQAFTMDGAAYIAKETEPYTQYRLNERYRILLTLYSTRHGVTQKPEEPRIGAFGSGLAVHQRGMGLVPEAPQS